MVLDEADEMLNMGFAEDVETILADTPEDKQLALFSATIPPQIRRIIKKYAPGPPRSPSSPASGTATNVTQRYLRSRTRRSSTPSPGSSRSRTSTG